MRWIPLVSEVVAWIGSESLGRGHQEVARYGPSPGTDWMDRSGRMGMSAKGEMSTLCLPITPYACTDHGGRRAMGLKRSFRLSAVVG